MRACLNVACILLALCLMAALSAQTHSLRVSGNRFLLDGERGQILYKSSGDLDGDGRKEMAFLAWTYDERFGGIVVAKQVAGKWQVVTTEPIGIHKARVDITDVNGDGKLEVVGRAMSGDGHMYCCIYVLKHGRLVQIGDFWDTRFRDLTGDGVPEVLSTSAMSFMFAGDHWLTIYKWNGHGYTDVSRRFPKQYDAVIRDLKKTIYELRYTKAYGSKHDPVKDSDLFADFYYCLGKAYEYRGLPDKAKTQYAIAYRLQPDDEEKAKAFRRIWKK